MTVFRRSQTKAERKKAKKARNSGIKGRKWEQEVARQLREILPKRFTVYRRPQNSDRHKQNDIEVLDNGHREIGIECKHRDKVNWADALEQAFVDCKPPAYPVAICKDDRCAPVAVMFLDDWLQLVAEAKGE